jgi:hypothetical protein
MEEEKNILQNPREEERGRKKTEGRNNHFMHHDVDNYRTPHLWRTGT